ncbi:MAG TPA: ornithine carbamoyltransferase subunit F, partial [Ktedonobacteraceae bacterium]|nr:ornithine carbamoyltransferase subunit F [Ktedonobacteraceae bacterium]
MDFTLSNRSFLKLDDFTPQEIRYLLQLSTELKAAKYQGTEIPRLRGKNIVLLFEKDSTRTRCAFEVAAFDQGANVTYLGPSGSHMGYKETMKDTARVLGRMYHGIEYRGTQQSTVEELARYSGVPVWNGLTETAHPTQALADLLTMQEHSPKPLEQVSFCFLGDVGFNVGDSLLIGGIKMGMDVRLAGPKEYWQSAERLEYIHEIARETGARVTLTEN